MMEAKGTGKAGRKGGVVKNPKKRLKKEDEEEDLEDLKDLEELMEQDKSKWKWDPCTAN